MRHSVFTTVSFAVLLFSLSALAQHSGGGGGASGGGSHGGSLGGGFSAGSAISSGGNSAHSSGSSGSHASSTHRSSGSVVHESSAMRTPPEKRNFFSALFHPLRKPESREVSRLLSRICPKGRCAVCPPGSSSGHWGCGQTVAYPFCSHREVWSGGACLSQTDFLDDCDSLRMLMEQQQRLAQAAEFARQNACAAGPAECAGLSGRAQAQESLYETYMNRYRMCRDRLLTALPFGRYGIGSYAHAGFFDDGLLFDPLL
jgi:hypothetical protein